ncbi:MAG TPA: hypothetical protein VFU43_25680 [Streptosporangiaceae bacterium]|nr:hypothetical protein [Streptosporangiaceae bacterium]
MNDDREGPPRPPVRRVSGPHRAQHCVLFAVDVAGFTDKRRDDEVQLAIRAALYDLLIEAFNDAHLPWDECLHEDRGDGILVIVPAKMPSATVVDPLLDHIRAALRRHNRLASDAAAIRLRAAVHIGEVHSDAHGLAGVAVNHLFRLLDAPVLKHMLAAARADVALIASDYFYESVLRHGPGMIDPAAYRPVTVEVKRTQARGWVHLPGAPLAPADRAGVSATAPEEIDRSGGYGAGTRPAPAPYAAPPPAQGFVFLGPTTIHGDAVAGDKIVNAKDADEPPR